MARYIRVYASDAGGYADFSMNFACDGTRANKELCECEAVLLPVMKSNYDGTYDYMGKVLRIPREALEMITILDNDDDWE